MIHVFISGPCILTRDWLAARPEPSLLRNQKRPARVTLLLMATCSNRVVWVQIMYTRRGSIGASGFMRLSAVFPIVTKAADHCLGQEQGPKGQLGQGAFRESPNPLRTLPDIGILWVYIGVILG